MAPDFVNTGYNNNTVIAASLVTFISHLETSLSFSRTRGGRSGLSVTPHRTEINEEYGSLHMKAWRAETFGKPSDVLKLVDIDVPVPGPGEALLRVLATNIGLPDRMMLEGRYFLVPTPPVTPGQEVVGIIEAAGRDYPFPIGTRVIGGTKFTTGSGGLA